VYSAFVFVIWVVELGLFIWLLAASVGIMMTMMRVRVALGTLHPHSPSPPDFGGSGSFTCFMLATSAVGSHTHIEAEADHQRDQGGQ
jgi:hypothetical protein